MAVQLNRTEELVKNHELLTKVLNHYLWQLELLEKNKGIKAMPNPSINQTSFEGTKNLVLELLAIKNPTTDDAARFKLDILTPAAVLYARDLDAQLKMRRSQIPSTALDARIDRIELELDLVNGLLPDEYKIDMDQG